MFSNPWMSTEVEDYDYWPRPKPTFSRDRMPAPTLAPRAPRLTPPPINPAETATPETIAGPPDPTGVPVPQLRGRSGPPRPYSPVTKAEFDYVQEHQDERGWKTGFNNFLAGMNTAMRQRQPGDTWATTLGRALGGGAAGAIGGKFDPTGGAEMRFNAWERPRIEQDIARKRAEEEYAMRQTAEQMKMAGAQSEIDLNRARAVGVASDIDLNRRRTELDREKADMERAGEYRLDEGTIFNTRSGLPGPFQPLPKPPEAAKDEWVYNADLGGLYNKRTAETRGSSGTGYGGGGAGAVAGGGGKMAAKLSSGDEKTLSGQAEALATKAFPPEQISGLLKKYSDEAYRGRVNPDDEKLAGEYDQGATQRIRQARSVADTEAKTTIEREMGRWRQLFHDELRERARRGMPPPQGAEVTENQVRAVAQSKNISVDDAYRFLGALGYTFKKPDPTLLGMPLSQVVNEIMNMPPYPAKPNASPTPRPEEDYQVAPLRPPVRTPR